MSNAVLATEGVESVLELRLDRLASFVAILADVALKEHVFCAERLQEFAVRVLIVELLDFV